MKTIQFAAGALLAAVMSAASATPITDFVNPNPDITITTSSPYVFYHDISDQGYLPGSMTISTASLTIHLMDSQTQGNETFSFLVGEGATTAYSGSNINNGANGQNYGVTMTAYFDDLKADGKLRVELRAASGSYEFADSTLVAEVNRVPEPLSLGLFAIGAAGLAATRRRQRR